MADLGHLRSFLAIYRAGSLTRAARLVHLTQPALSQQLRSLEAHLGRRLFTRLPRGLEPTPAAHDLATAIGPHLDRASPPTNRTNGGEPSRDLWLVAMRSTLAQP